MSLAYAGALALFLALNALDVALIIRGAEPLHAQVYRDAGPWVGAVFQMTLALALAALLWAIGPLAWVTWPMVVALDAVWLWVVVWDWWTMRRSASSM